MAQARSRIVAVCGTSTPDETEERDARRVGTLLAQHGVTVVNGGLGGVMAATAQGVAEAGGTCIGLLPGGDAADATPGLTVALPTGLGEMRNALIVRAADGVIAVGGGWGTLTEIAFAMRTGKPVVLLHSWRLSPPEHAAMPEAPASAGTADEAVSALLQMLDR